MPSKKKGGGAGGGGGDGGWGKEDDEVQAIVIADSFNRHFTPITYETPRSLLPLGNKVIIDYTLEYLLEQGVQEIIIFCCSFAEKIREYILNNWCNVSSKCNIQCVMSSTSDCLCVGDALREIDREGLIRSDFILLHGDLISNVKLAAAIKDHKENRKKEKNLVMTMLHRKACPGHMSRPPVDDTFVVLENETNRILFYQKSQACKKLVLPTNLLANRKEINIHYNLADCNVYICSPHLAPLFTDNFDYQTLDDFVKGILINEEILGDQIRSSMITDGYSSRVHDLHMYNIISLDLLNRWIYPLVPDNPSHIYKRNNVYVEKDVTIEHDCIITDGVMIGRGSSVGGRTSISKSVIGLNCKIGNNVEIKNSYIWDNCVIEDGVSLVQSLVCSNAVIKGSVNIIDSIISYNVCIGQGLNISPLTRLSLLRREDMVQQFEGMSLNGHKENVTYDFLFVGMDGKGYAWPFDSEEEDFIPSLTGTNYESSSDESSDDDEEQSLPPSPPVEYSNLEQFHMEVVENLRSGIAEHIAPDNIALEINASKFKFNISIADLCQTVVKALLELAVKDELRAKQDMVKDLDKIIAELHKLLKKYFNNIDEQIHAVTGAEDYFVSRPDISGIFATYLHKMYNVDLIDESVILQWYSSRPQDGSKQLRDNNNVVKLITWLQEAEEEDSEEDEDSD